ncbi:MAG TPA: response regulator [Stellaceae bacterium]|jgi:CheY-like chemotaxis protein|nr:response regulator [Stellaceae bacterium]
MDEIALQGRRILVIEDDYWVAQIVVEILKDSGAEVVGPIGWVEEALEALEGQDAKFDGAVLDINLHGTKSYPIADALSASGIPFVFTTGYGVAGIDDPYTAYPRCTKPFNRSALVAALTGV